MLQITSNENELAVLLISSLQIYDEDDYKAIQVEIIENGSICEIPLNIEQTKEVIKYLTEQISGY